MKGVELGLCEWRDGCLYYQGKIWIPEDAPVQTTLIHRHHDVPQAGHRETAKTPELICRKYYWPKMKETPK